MDGGACMLIPVNTNVDDGACMLIPVPMPLGGLIIIGEQRILYCSNSGSIDDMQ